MRDFPSPHFCGCAPSAWPASVVMAFVGAGAAGSAARRSRVGLGLLRLLILLLGSLRRFDGRIARSSRPAIPVNGGTVSSREPAVQR